MNVASAKTHIKCIDEICASAEKFQKDHEEDIGLDEMGFLCDAIGYLCDYKKILNQAINRAELDI